MTLSAISILKSKTRSSILKTFFDDPEKEYYLRQLEEVTGYSVGNIRREMIKLEADGIFQSRDVGKTKSYKLNKNYPLYDEIKSIVRKTIGVEYSLKEVLEKDKGIDFAFIYGSYAEAREHSLSDIDIIAIGSTVPRQIKSALFEYQAALNREINSIVYTKEEFLKKLNEKNHFISSIIKVKKIFIKGDENEFRRFVQIRKTAKA
ncbi:MAG: nucleotidyltransferase domain-containing protein [Candidatus Omnitrophica bacterium]|nr:nucleotidyltransferase domain-containing protein [Candidatus Omnitrophota bacterium]